MHHRRHMAQRSRPGHGLYAVLGLVWVAAGRLLALATSASAAASTPALSTAVHAYYCDRAVQPDSFCGQYDQGQFAINHVFLPGAVRGGVGIPALTSVCEVVLIANTGQAISERCVTDGYAFSGLDLVNYFQKDTEDGFAYDDDPGATQDLVGHAYTELPGLNSGTQVFV